MKPTRVHSLLVRVAFGTPCTRADAVAMFRDAVRGGFHGQHGMEISAVRSAKAHKPRAPLRAVSRESRFGVFTAEEES